MIGAVVAEFVAGTGGAEPGSPSASWKPATPRDPRLFAALFLLSPTGIVIYLLLDLVADVLRRWRESATRRKKRNERDQTRGQV